MKLKLAIILQNRMIECKEPELSKNICYQYAAVRNILYKSDKDIEILVNYESSLFYLAEWWKQLLGELEVKEGNGIYSSSANFTTDIDSFGQLIQDGKKNIFETIIMIDKPRKDLVIDFYENDFDGINYLAGISLNYINKKAFEGSLEAHESGDIPNIVTTILELNEFYIVKLIYFFQKSYAISAYTQGVNPFNQPTVEKYKNNMYRLLGRNIEATIT